MPSSLAFLGSFSRRGQSSSPPVVLGPAARRGTRSVKSPRKPRLTAQQKPSVWWRPPSAAIRLFPLPPSALSRFRFIFLFASQRSRRGLGPRPPVACRRGHYLRRTPQLPSRDRLSCSAWACDSAHSQKGAGLVAGACAACGKTTGRNGRASGALGDQNMQERPPAVTHVGDHFARILFFSATWLTLRPSGFPVFPPDARSGGQRTPPSRPSLSLVEPSVLTPTAPSGPCSSGWPVPSCAAT